jgi:hypothetical protein
MIPALTLQTLREHSRVHLQLGEAKRHGFDSSGLHPNRVVVTLRVGTGRSLTRRVEWSRCLAVSEGA